MIFLLSRSNSKYSQISGTHLCILADLNNAVVLMVTSCPLISKFSSLCTNTLLTVLRAPITFSFAVTLIFHSFFSSLARSRYFSLSLSLPLSLSLSLSLRVFFRFILLLDGTARSTIRLFLFYFCWLIWSSERDCCYHYYLFIEFSHQPLLLVFR